MLQTDFEFIYVYEEKIEYIPKNEISTNKDEILLIQKAWSNIQQIGLEKSSNCQHDWSLINTLGYRPPNFHNPFIRHFNSDRTGKKYFILMGNEDQFPWYEVNVLMNFASLQSDCLPLHASAVEKEDSLFIFTGISGAGKSTIAHLCEQIGGQILDDDQILISISSASCSANAWGSSLSTSSAKLRAVFNLVQAEKTKIVPLPSLKTAKIVAKRSLDLCGSSIPAIYAQRIIKLSSSFSRMIPGYELHFRKSPDFWKLIDAEIPS